MFLKLKQFPLFLTSDVFRNFDPTLFNSGTARQTKMNQENFHDEYIIKIEKKWKKIRGATNIEKIKLKNDE